MGLFNMLAVGLSAIALATAANAAPNLVQNGGFESVTGGPGRSHEFGASYIYGQTVNNWTSPDAGAFNLIFYPGEANGPINAATRFNEYGQFLWSSTASPTGGKFVALDGDTGTTNPIGPVDGAYNGPLNQTISGLTIGGTYTVSFDYAGAQYHDRSGDTTDNLFTTFGGVTQSTGTFTNVSHGFTGWIHASYLFTANATSEVLSFLSVGSPSGLPPVILLDGVSVVQRGGIGVPEPAMIGVLGLGLAGLAGLARLRRR